MPSKARLASRLWASSRKAALVGLAASAAIGARQSITIVMINAAALLLKSLSAIGFRIMRFSAR